VKDNFFEIGGHSLLAVQLFTKINDLYKVNIKLAALFQYPTINQLASFIKSELNIKSTDISSVQNHSNNYDSKIFQSLVPIRTSGSDLPIFMFHSVGGNVLNYVKLAIGIDDTHPIYGLQSRGVDGFSAMDNSIEDMASAYILEMKLISPKGPYILCGGSMGGSIAVEVAIQLEAMGDKIQKLIIFDTFGPNIDIKKLKDEGNNFFKNIKTSLYYRSMTIINKIRTTLLKGFGVSIPHSIRYFNIEMNNYKALWKYKPGVYRGDLILFRAPIDSSGWYSDPLMGWKGTIQGHIKTILLEGGHSDFVEIKELPLLLNKEIKD
jgi:pimeloyl-ACP methyl ester carboxylesterase